MASINMSIRIDSELKKQSEEILSALGMNMSGTINMFLTQIVREKSVPLNLSLNNDPSAIANKMILASQYERKNGISGYSPEQVLREMDDIIKEAEKKNAEIAKI